MRTLPNTLPEEFAAHNSTDHKTMHDINMSRLRLGLPVQYKDLLAPRVEPDGSIPTQAPAWAGGLRLQPVGAEAASAAAQQAATLDIGQASQDWTGLSQDEVSKAGRVHSGVGWK